MLIPLPLESELVGEGPDWSKAAGLVRELTREEATRFSFLLATPVILGALGPNTLYALDLADGSKKWDFRTGAPIRSAIIVDNGVAFFGDDSGKLFAVDIATGKEKWAAYNTGARIIASPAVADGVVYIASHDHLFHAVNASDGKLKWKLDAYERKLK